MGLDPQNQKTCFWHDECVNFKERKNTGKTDLYKGHAPLGKKKTCRTAKNMRLLKTWVL